MLFLTIRDLSMTLWKDTTPSPSGESVIFKRDCVTHRLTAQRRICGLLRDRKFFFFFRIHNLFTAFSLTFRGVRVILFNDD